MNHIGTIEPQKGTHRNYVNPMCLCFYVVRKINKIQNVQVSDTTGDDQRTKS